MSDTKVLTIQDISCVGQCSLTVALPIISACGLETCILPSAVLSTHTGGFTGFTFRDLTEDMPGIAAHWQKEGITFDGVYTGYLGSTKQIAYVRDIMDKLLKPNGTRIVDPAMADNGKLYTGFDSDFVREMAVLCSEADILLPNITEACFLTASEYCETGYDEAYILSLLHKLTDAGAKTVVLTGVSYKADELGVAVYNRGDEKPAYYFHPRLPGGSHGTGDVYASAFTGALFRGKTILESATIAADYTLAAIRRTKLDPNHWYGVKFEEVIPELIAALS